jgi:pimeloyl-ACP methyl ester carboxylesterase
MRLEPHHATSADGTWIYWESAGAGAPAVVLCDGIGCAGYIWRHLAPDLARNRRVIHWNYRGHGQSGHPHDPERVTLVDAVDDLAAVLADAGEQQVILAGHSMGVQVVLEAYRRIPERVAAMILVCGSPGRPLDSFHDSPALGSVFPLVKDLVLAVPDLVRAIFRKLLPTKLALFIGLMVEVNRQLLPPEDMQRYLAELASVDPAVFVRTLSDASRHDATSTLPEVAVPTLVVAGDRDGFTPLRRSMAMAAMIPDAELLVLPAGTHTGPLEHPELLSLRIHKFLSERLAPQPGTKPAVARHSVRT